MSAAAKQCRSCGVVKPQDEFTIARKNKDGRHTCCRDCTKQMVQRCKAKPEFKAKHRDYMREYLRKPVQNVKALARAAATHALRTGRLTKSATCESCNAAGKVYGHHPDYSQPLSVQWLCSTCHGKAHRLTPEPSTIGAQSCQQ